MWGTSDNTLAPDTQQQPSLYAPGAGGTGPQEDTRQTVAASNSRSVGMRAEDLESQLFRGHRGGDDRGERRADRYGGRDERRDDRRRDDRQGDRDDRRNNNDRRDSWGNQGRRNDRNKEAFEDGYEYEMIMKQQGKKILDDAIKEDELALMKQAQTAKREEEEQKRKAAALRVVQSEEERERLAEARQQFGLEDDNDAKADEGAGGGKASRFSFDETTEEESNIGKVANMDLESIVRQVWEGDDDEGEEKKIAPVPERHQRGTTDRPRAPTSCDRESLGWRSDWTQPHPPRSFQDEQNPPNSPPPLASETSTTAGAGNFTASNTASAGPGGGRSQTAPSLTIIESKMSNEDSLFTELLGELETRQKTSAKKTPSSKSLPTTPFVPEVMQNSKCSSQQQRQQPRTLPRKEIVQGTSSNPPLTTGPISKKVQVRSPSAEKPPEDKAQRVQSLEAQLDLLVEGSAGVSFHGTPNALRRSDTRGMSQNNSSFNGPVPPPTMGRSLTTATTATSQEGSTTDVPTLPMRLGTRHDIQDIPLDQCSTQNVAELLEYLGVAEHSHKFRRTTGRLLLQLKKEDLRERFGEDFEAADLLWVHIEENRVPAQRRGGGSASHSRTLDEGKQEEQKGKDDLAQRKRKQEQAQKKKEEDENLQREQKKKDDLAQRERKQEQAQKKKEPKTYSWMTRLDKKEDENLQREQKKKDDLAQRERKQEQAPKRKDDPNRIPLALFAALQAVVSTTDTQFFSEKPELRLNVAGKMAMHPVWYWWMYAGVAAYAAVISFLGMPTTGGCYWLYNLQRPRGASEKNSRSWISTGVSFLSRLHSVVIYNPHLLWLMAGGLSCWSLGWPVHLSLMIFIPSMFRAPQPSEPQILIYVEDLPDLVRDLPSFFLRRIWCWPTLALEFYFGMSAAARRSGVLRNLLSLLGLVVSAGAGYSGNPLDGGRLSGRYMKYHTSVYHVFPIEYIGLVLYWQVRIFFLTTCFVALQSVCDQAMELLNSLVTRKRHPSREVVGRQWISARRPFQFFTVIFLAQALYYSFVACGGLTLYYHYWKYPGAPNVFVPTVHWSDRKSPDPNLEWTFQ